MLSTSYYNHFRITFRVYGICKNWLLSPKGAKIASQAASINQSIILSHIEWRTWSILASPVYSFLPGCSVCSHIDEGLPESRLVSCRDRYITLQQVILDGVIEAKSWSASSTSFFIRFKRKNFFQHSAQWAQTGTFR